MSEPLAPPLLDVDDLSVHFRVPGSGWRERNRVLRAVDGVSFNVAERETLGIVGESGCGKSTLARALLRLVPTSSGHLHYAGRDLLALDAAALRPLRRELQIIFQDPLAALDPRMTVGQIIGEPLRALRSDMPRAERRRRVLAMMQRVGLLPSQVNRYAHEFSGGQAQRIGIARALAVEPRLLVCDEPVSSLDVSIKSQVINLLQELKAERALTLVFIAHDLASVRHIAQRVLVLYLGRVVEIAGRDAIFARPMHPYTRMLFAAAPIPDPDAARRMRAAPVRGEIPSPFNPPSGCAFRTRCLHAIERCGAERPALRALGSGQVACHRAEEWLAQPVAPAV
ncbi:oligopeptide/dipeptide ABC transporter, ATPase subunit [mine drainage metagenome]|uniref:Oligopeptide/dipeptide ABC transporter, ATPase subunit n=1 Tax=mine drainage metagenome TaxID=410659 RepID=T1BMC1_9ZZZZ